MAKLGVHARTQAVIVTTERGMVTPRPYQAALPHGTSGTSAAQSA
jgi:hypothetical protein